jgi:hypothetical protein
MLLAALLAANLCTPDGSVPAAVPSEVDKMVLVEGRVSDGTKLGWGTPVGSHWVLTAEHLAGDGVIEWIGQGKNGVGSIVWRDHDRDLAMFDITPSLNFVQFSKHPPKSADTLYWRFMLYDTPDPTATIRGAYVGQDDRDHGVLDGLIWPGSSGSGIFNTCGELVGVLSAVSPNPSPWFRSVGWATLVDESVLKMPKVSK